MNKFGKIYARLFDVKPLPDDDPETPMDECFLDYLLESYRKTLEGRNGFKVVNINIRKLRETIDFPATRASLCEFYTTFMMRGFPRYLQEYLSPDWEKNVEELLFLIAIFGRDLIIYDVTAAFLVYILSQKSQKAPTEDYLPLAFYSVSRIFMPGNNLVSPFDLDFLLGDSINFLEDYSVLRENPVHFTTSFVYLYKINLGVKQITMHCWNYVNMLTPGNLDGNLLRNQSIIFTAVHTFLFGSINSRFAAFAPSFNFTRSHENYVKHIKLFSLCNFKAIVFYFAVGQFTGFRSNLGIPEDFMEELLELKPWLANPELAPAPASMIPGLLKRLSIQFYLGGVPQAPLDCDEDELITIPDTSETEARRPYFREISDVEATAYNKIIDLDTDYISILRGIKLLDIFETVNRSLLWHFGMFWVTADGRKHCFNALTGELNSGDGVSRIHARVLEIFSRPPSIPPNSLVTYQTTAELYGNLLQCDHFLVDPNLILHLAQLDDDNPRNYIFREFYSYHPFLCIVNCILARIARIDYLFWFLIRNIPGQLWQSICYMLEGNDMVNRIREFKKKQNCKYAASLSRILDFTGKLAENFEQFNDKWYRREMNQVARKIGDKNFIDEIYDPCYGSSDNFTRAELSSDFTAGMNCETLFAKYAGMYLRFEFDIARK